MPKHLDFSGGTDIPPAFFEPQQPRRIPRAVLWAGAVGLATLLASVAGVAVYKGLNNIQQRIAGVQACPPNMEHQIPAATEPGADTYNPAHDPIVLSSFERSRQPTGTNGANQFVCKNAGKLVLSPLGLEMSHLYSGQAPNVTSASTLQP